MPQGEAARPPERVTLPNRDSQLAPAQVDVKKLQTARQLSSA